MKRYLTYMIVSAMTLLLAGCSLDEDNRSNIPTEKEWSTAEGYTKLINNCYYDFVRIIYGQGEDTFISMSETGTDIWQDVSNSGGWRQMATYDGLGASTGQQQEAYAGFYATVNTCNAAIKYAEIVKGLSKEQIDALVAEAHFLRAHSLFNIVEYFGGKYLSESYTESPVSVLPVSSVNDFYKVILKDLEFAKTHLPITQEIRGHVTRAAAYHLYAKAALTYSTYTDGLAGATPITQQENKELLTNAKTAIEHLINNQNSFGVKMYDEASEVFASDNNKTNTEALFVVTHSGIQAYNPRGNYFNRCWKHFGAYNNNTSGIYLVGVEPSYKTEIENVAVTPIAKANCYFAPSKYYLSLLDNRKDTRYKAYFRDTYYINKPTEKGVYKWTETDAARYGLDKSRVGNDAYNIAIGDTAIYLTRDAMSQSEKDACRYAVYNIEDNYADPAQPKKFFPSLKKYDMPGLYAGSNPNKPYTSADCIIYRLAESYLIAAEIYWRLGLNDKAADMINVVRNRACDGHDNSLNISENEVSQDYLLDEYAREMGGEWSRWTTLKRFRALESRIKKGNPQIKSFDKNIHYLRPIPVNELLLINNAEEYQNPGY